MRKKGKFLHMESNRNATSDGRADVVYLEKSNCLVILDWDYLWRGKIMSNAMQILHTILFSPTTPRGC